MKLITLESALAMLRAATGPSEELRHTVELAFFDRDDYPKVGTLVSSACGDVGALDACVELAQYLMPGANWFLARGVTRIDEPLYGARILRGQEPIGEGESNYLPIAFLIAILSALSAKAGGAGRKAS